jgi:hypothetical protein
VSFQILVDYFGLSGGRILPASEDQILHGTGAMESMLGVCNAASTITVDKEKLQAAGTVDALNIDNIGPAGSGLNPIFRGGGGLYIPPSWDAVYPGGLHTGIGNACRQCRLPHESEMALLKFLLDVGTLTLDALQRVGTLLAMPPPLAIAPKPT